MSILIRKLNVFVMFQILSLLRIKLSEVADEINCLVAFRSMKIPAANCLILFQNILNLKTMLKIQYLRKMFLYIICSIGLFIHIGEVCKNYFIYPTESKVSIDKHTKIETPSVSACFPKHELFKKDILSNISTGSSSVDDWDLFQFKTENFTVKNYFDFTPNENEVYLNITNSI